jgi:glycosyltransferase involved in cell wall biosynthesis
MRIAFFHNLPSGGGKRSAQEWIKRMTRRHSVDLYLYDPRAEDFLDMRPFVKRTIAVGGGDAARGGPLARLNALRRVRTASEEVARRINRGGYDLAFVMQCKVSNSPFVLRHLEIPSLYFCHEPAAKTLEPHFRGRLADGRLQWIKTAAISWIVSADRASAVHATLICANSLYSRETIYRAYGVYPRLNYPGVDETHFRRLGLDRKPVVLSVGALNAAKGQDFIIESLGTIRTRPLVRFVYNFGYGASDYQTRLAERAESLRVPVMFDCFLTDDALVTAYNEASLTAFPSILEPFGLVPLESMACETPVVGVAEAGVRETVTTGVTGVLTERDPIEFGRVVEELLLDPARRAEMGRRGRDDVLRRWTWESSYEQLETHMSMAIERFESGRAAEKGHGT